MPNRKVILFTIIGMISMMLCSSYLARAYSISGHLMTLMPNSILVINNARMIIIINMSFSISIFIMESTPYSLRE